MKHLLLLLAIATGVATCDKIDSDKKNPCKPLELSTKSAEMLEKGHAFSFEFIEQVNNATKQDFIISPLSMQFLLGMVLDGAETETADEICTVLGYGKGEKADVDEYSLSILKQLPKMDKKTKLNLANALFADKNFPVKDAFKSRVSNYYKAEIANLDFSNSAKTLKVINGWASDNTNKMIPSVLNEVSPDIPVYLMNALYFKGQWKNQFDKKNTAEEKFTGESGATSQVKMMKLSEHFDYAENDVFKTLVMPYGNGAFSMVAMLPKEGYKVADVITYMKGADWKAFREGMRNVKVNVWFPRFETKYHIQLNDILSDMGMPRAFTPQADFSSLSPEALFLYFVQQDAIIKVDEEGTEAAAVSVAAFGKMAADGPSIYFYADHPFLYLITESSTGAILFAGRYGK